MCAVWGWVIVIVAMLGLLLDKHQMTELEPVEEII
jgi:hypothetical protein